MSHEGLHEPADRLAEPVHNFHRAVVSLMEELEAVDWYYQRAAVTEDASLKEILLHNAHEEIEHAMMVLEWIRRQDAVVDKNMRTYLFKSGNILATEADAARTAVESPRPALARPTVSASLGSLRESAATK